MIAEFVQFLGFFLFTVAFLKVGAAWLNNNSPGSAFANGLAWFVPA